MALGEAIWLHDRGLEGPRSREGGGRLPLMTLVCPLPRGLWPLAGDNSNCYHPKGRIAEFHPALNLLKYFLYVPGCP